jgi:benzaldehyde dehydrogenase (NAD)
MGASGNGARSGGPSVMNEYSQWQWITVNEKVPAYPFDFHISVSSAVPGGGMVLALGFGLFIRRMSRPPAAQQ